MKTIKIKIKINKNKQTTNSVEAQFPSDNPNSDWQQYGELPKIEKQLTLVYKIQLNIFILTENFKNRLGKSRKLY